MDAAYSDSVHIKRFALRVATMIDSRLIWYKHYYRWADELVAVLEHPPLWVIEIATIRYIPDAVSAVNRFVYSEPFEPFDCAGCSDEHIACLFLKHRSGATSWATFLSNAGAHADSTEGRCCCEYFFEFLNELEDNEYDREVELRQRRDVETQFLKPLATIQPLHDTFMRYFRDYVKSTA